ncbi:3-dehydroquinate synthase [Selenomonas sp. TAMA-11512]|uniref:3-dehydroquinate synthase n=1 Tax=Selenomonas sp. TAMA-11512 TaxID=3095337 RepID=UPI00308F249E|nr:3-dehydroquinate synthase [Selenomonas sp. TAMA-11512]
MRKVRVNLGEKSYDIVISRDLLGELTKFVAGKKYSRQALVVSDTNVAPLFGAAVLEALRAGGLEPMLAEIPAGEASKSFAAAEDLYTKAIELGLDRKSPVFALGGGVVGDLTGYIAATYMRGVPFVQIPTSLLAQVDSSVGGKVAINHPLGKNLIGAFYQPDAVFCDMTMLEKLPKREISTGLGEIIKYGIIWDEELFTYLEQHAEEVLRGNIESYVYMVTRSCEIKAEVVSKDEREGGLRRILNYGHTIGHTIEKETNYTTYNHGEAVAIGSIGAALISRSIGLVGNDFVDRLYHLTKSLQLPTSAAGVSVEAMYGDIFHDKKTIGGKVAWVLTEGLGKTVIRDDVPETVIKHAMQACTR